MRGRRPQPKAKLRLVATFRQDRHGKTPDPPASPAECLVWLTGPARTYWPEISKALTAMRINSSHYTLTVALLAGAVADWIRFSELAANEGPVETTDKGNAVQNPIFGLKNKAWARVLTACREFGMSPWALRAIQIPEGSPMDELDEVLA
jgi:P27 family predicted phage terminase small subunit